MLIKRGIILSVLIVLSMRSFGQQSEKAAWVSWLSSYKLSEHWGLHWDIQPRSADEAEYLRNLLIRPGITYHFNKTQNATLGYAWIGNFNPNDDFSDNSFTEHRIWEQFIQTHKLKSAFLTHRFRLEQRFIGRPADAGFFSQRFRYFVRAVLPLKKYEESFQKGPYLALQDEVFLHLQNKDRLNNEVFDQNRAYLALGTRISPKLDLELGYMNQLLNGSAENTTNNILQLGVTTRF